jgi:hypothetical protein
MSTRNTLFSILVFILSCENCSPEKRVVSTKNFPAVPTEALYGDWFYYDSQTRKIHGDRPIFGLRREMIFLDTLQSICRLEKRQAGEDWSVYPPPVPFIDFPNAKPLENCPEYSFRQEGARIEIIHRDGSMVDPSLSLEFVALDPGNSAAGQVEFAMYVETRPKPGIVGNAVFAPESAKNKRAIVIRTKPK